MASDKNSNTSANKSTPADKSISIGRDVVDSVVIVGDNNTTFFQKVINIFKSDAETLEQRNRRILLGHMENAWIKGVLDASLHGAALLDVGIKQDPEAVAKYPWAIKKESTNETLPAGTSMLEIFDSIGMGRSLLILGAPGSGKTTMLLELARQLIARAREDVTYPIPMVFNLASWTEKLSLADWLAQELNNLYSVPRKTAPDWVKGDKLLLLLDGLDEVRQESRAKCVEAINAFRKEHGLTSLAVCSRSQDYADLKAKLSFEGAIEVQPLTQKQITKFFSRFGDEMAGMKQALEKDDALREMAETPLFLSIMLMAYRDKQDVEILVSGDEKARRKHLFDTYIKRMFERRSENTPFKKQDVLRWLSWLAEKMIGHNVTQNLLEELELNWLNAGDQKDFKKLSGLISGFYFGLIIGLSIGMNFGIISGLFSGIIFGTFIGIIAVKYGRFDKYDIGIKSYITDVGINNYLGLILGVLFLAVLLLIVSLLLGLAVGLVFSLIFGLISGMIAALIYGLNIGLVVGLDVGLGAGLLISLVYWLALLNFGALQYLFQLFALHIVLPLKNILPWNIKSLLDDCTDRIFLRKVGSRYIFVHRLLMEHFAEMYLETPTPKGNQK